MRSIFFLCFSFFILLFSCKPCEYNFKNIYKENYSLIDTNSIILLEKNRQYIIDKVDFYEKNKK